MANTLQDWDCTYSPNNSSECPSFSLYKGEEKYYVYYDNGGWMEQSHPPFDRREDAIAHAKSGGIWTTWCVRQGDSATAAVVWQNEM
ncbi:MAG: hypothetical protein ACRC62_15430 [Microcoleus sp.]